MRTRPEPAYWWAAGIFAGGAVVAGVLLRSGPLDQLGTPPVALEGVPTAQPEAEPPGRPGSAVTGESS